MATFPQVPETGVGVSGEPIRGTITLQVPATSAHTAIARSAVASTVAAVGATADDVDDLRLVVSEAFALLLEHSHADALITIHLQHRDELMHVTLITTTSNSAPVLEQSLAWTVLTTLAESVDVVVQPADPLFELTLNVQYRVQIPS
jgi:serine/threonine-protein kinase RsbW